MSHRTPLTWLYVPGDRPERIAKAIASQADCVIVDLEDAVTPDHKDRARDDAMTLLASAAREGRAVQVRVNQPGSPWYDDDIAAVAHLDAVVGVRVPKCEEPDALRRLAEALPSHPLHLLVESALGLEHAMSLATSTPAVATIGLGESDLSAALGVQGEDGLAYARGRLVAVAAAAGLPPPAMSVFADVGDLDGLRASCARGRGLGFLGRAAIHPAQLPVIGKAFTPSGEEVMRAREVVDSAADAARVGRGAVALPDGRFVDEAVVRQARRLLDLTDTD